MALSQQLKQDLVELAGGSEEFMGTAEIGNTQISGTLAKMRASNSVETLQDILDNLNYAQEGLGRKIVKLIKINLPRNLLNVLQARKYQKSFFKRTLRSLIY